MSRALVLAGGCIAVNQAMLFSAGFYAAQAGNKIIPEIVHSIHYRNGRALAESAFAVFQQLFKVGDCVKIGFFCTAVQHRRQEVGQYLCPFFARGTFAATVKSLDPFHILCRHGRDIHRSVKKYDSVPAHKSCHGVFAVMSYRQAEGRPCCFTPLAVIDYISTPAGKNHLRHLSLRSNSPCGGR